jgi:hypothetical protein
MKTLPIVVAVVLNYRRSQETIQCVNLLSRSTYENMHIVIVDNASHDDSVAAIRAAFPEAEIIESPNNTGYAGGMNRGIEIGLKKGAKYLLLINSDTLVDPRSVEHLVNALEINANAAAASGIIYSSPNPRQVWYAGGDLKVYRASAFSRKHLPPQVEQEDVTFISGCAFLVAASALTTVGRFDERFFMYLEDAELCVRFLRAGYRLLFVPEAVFYHLEKGETLTPLRLYYSTRNRLLFLELQPKSFLVVCGYMYFWAAIISKLTAWMFTNHEFFLVGICAVRDYLQRKFFEARFSFRGDTVAVE